MHRFANRSSIFRLQFCALLYVVGYGLLIVSALSLAVFMMMRADVQLLRGALAGFGFGAILLFFQWLLSQRVYCPLCRMPVIGKKSCNRHRNASKRFGSYRIPVALGVLFNGWFRCPYCNEPSALEVRNRPDAGRYRG